MIRNYYELAKTWGKRNSTKSFLEKVKITIISIGFGILFGMLIILGLGYNPFIILGNIFNGAFKSETSIKTTLIFASVFTIAGLSNAFAFKTGLFNIGVSGQMLAGGGISLLIGLQYMSTLPVSLAIILLIVIAISVAALVGLLVGLLKSMFNVNEVVSTILLNWIIFYIIKYLFRTSQSFVNGDGNSRPIVKALQVSGNSATNSAIIVVAIALVVALLMFLIIRFTTFGRKLTMTGINKNAAKYAGINVKRMVIFSLSISSGIAGLLGFVYYFGYRHFMPRQTDFLPTEGFDGIAIALLAFSSPLAIPIISLFYAVFKEGANFSGMESTLSSQTVSLVFSIIIFFAAISSLFITFKPIAFMKWIIYTNRSDKISKIRADKKNAIKHALKSYSLHDAEGISKADKKEIHNNKKHSISNAKNNANFLIRKEYNKIVEIAAAHAYKGSYYYVSNEINNFYKDKISNTIFSSFERISNKEFIVRTIKQQGNKDTYKKEKIEFNNYRTLQVKKSKEQIKSIKKLKKIKLKEAKKNYFKDIKNFKDKEQKIAFANKVIKKVVK